MSDKIISKPSSEVFRVNFDEIEWRDKGTYCYDCGRTFLPEQERNFYEDGHAYCCGQCNFN